MAETNESVTQRCLKIYKEVLNLVTWCKSNPDETVVNESVVFCDMKIDLLKTLHSIATSAGQKQSCYFTINLIQSLRDDLRFMFVEEGGRVDQNNVKWLDSESAFEKSIRVGIIKNLRHIDPDKFFEDAKNVFSVERKKTLDERKHNLEVYTVLEATYARQKGEKTVEELKHFNTKSFPIYIVSDNKKLFAENVIGPTLRDMEEFQERESGWTLKRIELLNVIVSKYNAMRCGSYLPLPKAIKIKNACINVKNNDNLCFKWAVLSALTHLEGNNPHHSDRVNEYRKYEHVFNLNFSGLEFPIDPLNIPKFEAQNNLSVNLYILQWEFNKWKVLPIYLTSDKKDEKRHIRLLLVEENFEPSKNKTDRDEEAIIVPKRRKQELLSKKLNYHYVWIKNLPRLISSQVSNHNGAINICDRCLAFFHSDEKLKAHEINCLKLNKCAMKLPSPNPEKEEDDSYKTVKFKNIGNKEEVPFVVYADFESVLKKIDNGVRKLNEHQPCAVGYYFICSYDESKSFYRDHVGQDSSAWFVKELRVLAEKVDKILKNPKPMDPLTQEEEREFREAVLCHICVLPFKDGDERVRDHSHLTGKFRGAAHNGCNLNFKDWYAIPVIFHNLSGYDGHYLINDLANAFDGRINVIPLNKEKYISFTKHIDDLSVSLRFIDSLRFLNASLDKLVKTMDELPLLEKAYSYLTPEQRGLLFHKGTFCYEYLDSMQKLEDTTLPSIDKFYSSLNDCSISEEEHQLALKVFEVLKCKNLKDYLLHYLKRDVILTADVFQKFARESIRIYGLDPRRYFSAPGLSFDAMLKRTKIELELLTDEDMVLFFERGVRGGVSQCSNRFSQANNKYMEDFDTNQESKYIMYFDVNNLYGYAMTKPLPTGGFRWLTTEELENIHINLLSEDSPKGYIFEVDLAYPENIHEEHKDLPFCPEHAAPPGSKQKKLLTTLYDKENYVIHYMYLKQVLKHGLKLKKIKSALEFDQSRWLKEYIDLNSKLRREATNDFQKDFTKLMNNAVFGKTLENVRKHQDVKIVNRWEGRYGAEYYISKPNFHSCTIFNKNLVAIEMEKLEVLIDKPIYVGMCILDIAKVVLYEFHYDFAKKKFGSDCKLLYTDTDSLLYEIKHPDVFEVMKENIERFDTSDYPPHNPYKLPQLNKKIPGLMKDECNGKIITSMWGLRSKMYCLQVDYKDFVKKAKGIKSNVVKNTINSSHYNDCLMNSSVVYREQCVIRSHFHKLYTEKCNKLALSPFDDKRYLIPNSTDTLPWGHKDAIEPENL